MAITTISIVTACSEDYDFGKDDMSINSTKSSVVLNAESGYNQLIQSFKTSAQSRAVGQKYPIYYGEAYIDNDRLIVNIAPKHFGYNTLDNVLDKVDYEMRKCEFSYNELEEIMFLI